MENLMCAELYTLGEELTPVVHAGFLGVIKAILRDIFVGHVDQAACVVIRFGLEVIRDTMGGLGPLPLELGGVLVLVNHF